MNACLSLDVRGAFRIKLQKFIRPVLKKEKVALVVCIGNNVYLQRVNLDAKKLFALPKPTQITAAHGAACRRDA